MPITAKLSLKFYERLGDEIAGEIVDWFNLVDAEYQGQLRETNDLNWERFKAELRAQGAELRGEMAAMAAGLRGEMAAMESRLRGEMVAMGAELRGEMAAMESRLRGEMVAMGADLRSELIKWMFIFWTGTLIPLAGLIIALHRN